MKTRDDIQADGWMMRKPIVTALFLIAVAATAMADVVGPEMLSE